MKYQLRDMSGKVLSEHPNVEGAQLSALRYIQNGEKLIWIKGAGTIWGSTSDIRHSKFEIWCSNV